jgi:hypothetical protein
MLEDMPSKNFAQVCFKLITVVVRDCDTYKISDKDLRKLVEYIADDMEDLQNHNVSFSLLKVCSEMNSLLYSNLKH